MILNNLKFIIITCVIFASNNLFSAAKRQPWQEEDFLQALNGSCLVTKTVSDLNSTKSQMDAGETAYHVAFAGDKDHWLEVLRDHEMQTVFAFGVQKNKRRFLQLTNLKIELCEPEILYKFLEQQYKLQPKKHIASFNFNNNHFAD